MASVINASTTLGLVNSADTSGVLQLQTSNTAALTIDGSQNVGIGTASPTQKLSINSGASTTIAGFTSTGSSAFLALANSGATTFVGNDNTSGSFVIQTPSSGYSTKLTVNNTGNLGLGVTPSAWNITGKAMDFAIYGTINSLDDGTKGNFQIGYNYYQTAAATFNYKVGDLASMYRQRAGVHSWYTAPSGTAGNAISFTQAATLTAGGNYLLGDTSDYLASRLYVKTTTTDSSTNALTLRNSANTDLFRVRSDGYTYAGFYPQTSASVANVFISSGGDLLRSISALKYKQDVRDLESIDINKFRAVRYKSKCDADDQTLDHFGFIADEVDAAGVKELVVYSETNEVEGFRYDRMTAVLLKAIQDLKSEFDAYKAAHP